MFELRKWVKNQEQLLARVLIYLFNISSGQYTLLLNRIFYSIWHILHKTFDPTSNMHEKDNAILVFMKKDEMSITISHPLHVITHLFYVS